MMNCKLISSNVLFISNIPIDNHRKFMKLKIFLNANQNLKCVFNNTNTNLEIKFNICDNVIITKEINKIISFIENLFNLKIDLDSQIKQNISREKILSSGFKYNFDKLKKLKSTNINDNKEFIRFCDFCDRTLNCKLRPYQYTASFFLTIGQGGFNFSVPGSGKTIITYAAYNFLKHQKICDSILIIGPINSFYAWHDEYVTCFGIKPDFYSLALLTKNDSETYLLSSKENHSEITFVNNDKAWRIKKEILHFIGDKKILLIVDEAHKEKNPNAQITKAVLEISKYTKYRIILTGTPLPNGYEDLYSLIKIYEPYEKILPYNYSELLKLTKYGATENQQKKLMSAIKPLYSRVSKAHLLNTGELLPPNYFFINCELSNEQQEIYDFLNKMAYDLDDDFESILNVSMMKAILVRKMQVSANPGLLLKSIINSIDEYRKEYCDEFYKENLYNEEFLKADNKIRKAISNSPIANLVYKFESGYYQSLKNIKAVDLALEITSKGEKVIIWDIFVQNMYAIKKLLDKKSPVHVEIINGMVNGHQRQEAIERFRIGHSKILIANPATLAESISLHKTCHNAIYVNRNFNAAQFIQSKDRIHRINMPKGKTANYYFLINKNTVDESVQERLKIKEERMIKILDSEELEIGGNEFENTSFMSFDDIITSFRK